MAKDLGYRVFSVLVACLPLSACGSGASPSPVQPSTPVALTIPGIALYCPFNGDASDLSGIQNNGQVNGATLTKDRFGNSNRAYHFDGVDDSITFDASRMPAGHSPRTISAWVNLESFPPEAIPGLGSRATVIGWGISDWDKLSEMLILDGRLQYHTYDSFGRDVTGNVRLELNQWYHLAITYGEDSVSVYVNGVEDKCGPGALDTGSGKGKIGAYPDPSPIFDGSYFHGTIDDVSIYSQALSAAQIKALYTEGGWGNPVRTLFPAVTPAPTAATQEMVTVMTYNIENGGGAGPTDPNGRWCCGPPPRGCCGAGGGNRLPRILEVIRAANPDILGIQEAFLWQLDDEAIARQVAAELGVNYFIGESGDADGAHVALFTRFDIADAENYPGAFETGDEPGRARAGLHAELITDSGRTLHVFVVHLRPYTAEISFLLEQMRPYLNDLTLLLGDMNFTDPSDQAIMLRDAGWKHPLAKGQDIDQIWTSPALELYVQSGPWIPPDLIRGTSDHPPYVLTIGIPPS